MKSSLPLSLVQEIEAKIGTISDFSFSSGGCINHGGRLTTKTGVFFLKWNNAGALPAMFSTEVKGLLLLKRAEALYVPNVVFHGESNGLQFLLMEYIDEGTRGKDYWQKFGSGLASLHKKSTNTYGLDYDNYIGSLPQKNKPTNSWTEFFIERRLTEQLTTGIEKGTIGNDLVKKFEHLFSRLWSLLPDEPPSLLHGDLWSGNLMTTPGGEPCLIDPAVYYGHREVDLAMTQLFGGFGLACLDSYHECYPLLPDYRERLDLYNLYPLLVHVNLFGRGYSVQIEDILRKYV